MGGDFDIGVSLDTCLFELRAEEAEAIFSLDPALVERGAHVLGELDQDVFTAERRGPPNGADRCRCRVRLGYVPNKAGVSIARGEGVVDRSAGVQGFRSSRPRYGAGFDAAMDGGREGASSGVDGGKSSSRVVSPSRSIFCSIDTGMRAAFATPCSL